ncbi:hypothetical protein HBE99_04430 [Mycobacteroides chelonae]|uniref:hypothetical protein n=1 Tax=Mycobacteroides chelonae TaxID=1774 RepID=UPI00191026D7|nr:hypothetical protein [Mycobacteroides chelonae]QQG96192.1 hypothetical protein HBE99_04430 [Mycobacteroides chelonae]
MSELQAILPEGIEETAISDMTVGDVAYTVPWAMWVDRQRRCWLRPDFSVETAPCGTASMRIRKRTDGFHVERTGYAREYEWRISDTPSAVVGANSTDYIPVRTLS